ncbi:MAG TPA: DUF4112 domain-containing protein [Flavobacteriales bacterium]|jgi:hypothetical protein|nr:DUF4112 domain-containing protein [Flavobacteriales bacterium]
MDQTTFQDSPELRWVERVSKLLDSKFRIPGTGIRFGLDPLFGLLPVAGDIGTMVISLSLVYTMYRHGASGRLVAKMVGNVLIDVVLGSIPLIGIALDVYYKPNNRNVRLLKEYYRQGKHRGSASGVIVPVLLVTLLITAGLIYGAVVLVMYIIEWLGG